MSRFNNLELGGESEEFFGDQPLAKDGAFYFAEATKAFEQGNFEEGLRAYSKVLEHNPDHAAAWTGQVRMLIELGEFREAKLWADKALERFPHEPELLASKAVALARTGDLKGALAFSDASIEERGNTPYVWLARGDVLMARKEKLAQFSFDKAFLLAPGDWFVAWLASRIYFFYKKISIALKLAQRALAINTGKSVVWLQLGNCQFELGLVDMAIHSFEQAQELDPQSSEARKGLSRASEVGPFFQLKSWWHWLLKS